ncbi:trypsin 3A1-like [Macrobrachium rosenbergii]|uniref:trypsin 3A1-like n=1 Tax=Macrobrachium rosenbergii TaxID=79674 RepID=UPI0034D55EE0
MRKHRPVDIPGNAEWGGISSNFDSISIEKQVVAVEHECWTYGNQEDLILHLPFLLICNLLFSLSDTVLPVSRCKCGRTNSALRIVGGNQVEPNEYPWQVALFRNNETSPFCGGSIISDTWVLTAAHCLVSVRPENLEVVIGEHDWSTSEETNITRRIKAKYIVWHEGFSSRKPLQHDIGLVELDESLDFPEDNSVAPVCLPRPHLGYPKANALVVGWGATEDKFGGPSKVLRFANVKTMTNEACQALVALLGGVTPNTICAGHLFSGETACHGDSGGPLLAEGEGCGGKCLTNIGIVSWGAFCKIGALPTVYTRTNRYLGWINMFIKRSNTCQV